MAEPSQSAPCYACGYHAAGAVRCPECGADLSAAARDAFHAERWRWRWSDKALAIAAVTVQVVGTGGFAWLDSIHRLPRGVHQFQFLVPGFVVFAIALGVVFGFRLLRRRHGTPHALAWCIPLGLLVSLGPLLAMALLAGAVRLFRFLY